MVSVFSYFRAAFTLWNLQPDPAAKITADVTDVSVGRLDSPVLGSGVFVAGYGNKRGAVQLQRLETGAVYSCHGSNQAGYYGRDPWSSYYTAQQSTW
jgi:hypothetical protein